MLKLHLGLALLACARKLSITFPSSVHSSESYCSEKGLSLPRVAFLVVSSSFLLSWYVTSLIHISRIIYNKFVRTHLHTFNRHLSFPHVLLLTCVCVQTIHALWHFNEQSPSPVIGAHREGHRLRLDRRGPHNVTLLPPSTFDDAPAAPMGTAKGGGAPPAPMGGGRRYDSVMEWPDVPKSASRRGLGSGPPPVDPAIPMGTRIDLVNPSADEVSGGTSTGISS